MTRKVLIAFPEPLLNRADMVACAECRSRSDLVREALRRYLENFSRNRSTIADEIQAIPSLAMATGHEHLHLKPIAK